MGFNSKHHDSNEATETVVHLHKGGKKHIHHQKKEKHCHDRSASQHEGSNNQKGDENKGNCCTDRVKEFHLPGKSVPGSISLVHPVFFTAFIATYNNINIFPYDDVVKDIKPFVRSYHPPIHEIRIAIQSFQI
jgi:hypothetical protein